MEKISEREIGEEWDKIIREHKEHPLNPKMPQIKSSENSTLVTLFSTREKFEKKKYVLDKRQRKIINFIEKNGKITTTQCAALLNISNDTALRELSKLMSLDLIRGEGIGRGIYCYQIMRCKCGAKTSDINSRLKVKLR